MMRSNVIFSSQMMTTLTSPTIESIDCTLFCFDFGNDFEPLFNLFVHQMACKPESPLYYGRTLQQKNSGILFNIFKV